jgi:hypothetical protein
MSDDICSKCQKKWSAKSCCMMHQMVKIRLRKQRLKISLYDFEEILRSPDVEDMDDQVLYHLLRKVTEAAK